MNMEAPMIIRVDPPSPPPEPVDIEPQADATLIPDELILGMDSQLELLVSLVEELSRHQVNFATLLITRMDSIDGRVESAENSVRVLTGLLEATDSKIQWCVNEIFKFGQMASGMMNSSGMLAKMMTKGMSQNGSVQAQP